MHREDYSKIEGLTHSLLADFQRERTRRRISGRFNDVGQLYRSKGKYALFILDMQDYFLKSDSHAFIPSAKAIIPRIAELRQAFLDSGNPVIFTRHINTEQNAGMMGTWWRELITEDKPLSRITEELSTDGCHIVTKPQYDAFFDTELGDILAGVQSLVITGIMTHICAETTARSGFVRGYEIFFTADGTATYNLEMHRGSLAGLSHGFAHILSCKEILL